MISWPRSRQAFPWPGPALAWNWTCVMSCRILHMRVRKTRTGPRTNSLPIQMRNYWRIFFSWMAQHQSTSKTFPLWDRKRLTTLALLTIAPTSKAIASVLICVIVLAAPPRPSCGTRVNRSIQAKAGCYIARRTASCSAWTVAQRSERSAGVCNTATNNLIAAMPAQSTRQQ